MPMALKSDVTRAAKAAGTSKPVDLVHLSMLTSGDRDLEREVLGIFISQADSYLVAWKAAADQTGRKRAAHTLKGAARSIGAWELAEIAEQAERPGFPDSAGLEAEMARVCSYIRSLD